MTSTLRLVDHPLIHVRLTEARDKRTTPERFRWLVSQIAQVLVIEAFRDLPTEATTVDTPLTAYVGRQLTGPITIVPILRAGLAMADAVHQVIPSASMGHIGLYRNEETLVPVQYYERMPNDAAAGPVLLVDPMLATGGSLVVALQRLRDAGCTDLRVLCLLAAPEGVDRLATAFPDVPVFAGALDDHLNEQGYIVPGLGDAGDRIYGTL